MKYDLLDCLRLIIDLKKQLQAAMLYPTVINIANVYVVNVKYSDSALLDGSYKRCREKIVLYLFTSIPLYLPFMKVEFNQLGHSAKTNFDVNFDLKPFESS